MTHASGLLDLNLQFQLCQPAMTRLDPKPSTVGDQEAREPETRLVPFRPASGVNVGVALLRSLRIVVGISCGWNTQKSWMP